MISILIIDDDPKIVEVITSYLQKEGFYTLTAFNGKEALYSINVNSIDFVIIDLILPDISGEELCQIIRRNYSFPILILSAKTAVADKINGLSIGADDYMTKPFSPRELVLRIKNVLRRSRY